MFEVGKLYKCSCIDFFLYPSIHMAMKFFTETIGFAFLGNTTMQYRTKVLSERYKCKIDFYEKTKPFMIVDQRTVDGFMFIKIIYEEKMGWMTWQDWLQFERLN